MQLSAQNSLKIVKTKIKLDSYADTFVIGDQCLVIHYCNKPVNVYRYDAKSGSKYACVINPIVAYDELETDQVVIFLINQAIEMKCLDHHLLCPMQCCMNDDLIDELCLRL